MEKLTFRQFRKSRLIPLREIAEGTGLSITAIHFIENKKKKPREKTITKLADFFGLTYDEMFDIVNT